MKRERRTSTLQDRLAATQEEEREGSTVTCGKYYLSPSLYARWTKKYLSKVYRV